MRTCHDLVSVTKPTPPSPQLHTRSLGPLKWPTQMACTEQGPAFLLSVVVLFFKIRNTARNGIQKRVTDAGHRFRDRTLTVSRCRAGAPQLAHSDSCPSLDPASEPSPSWGLRKPPGGGRKAPQRAERFPWLAWVTQDFTRSKRLNPGMLPSFVNNQQLPGA